MDKKCVEDIMVPIEDYPCVAETHTLRHAIDELGKARIQRGTQTSLPRVVLVFNERLDKLVGLLGRREMMRGLEPRFMVESSHPHQKKLFDVEIDPNLSELSYERTIAGIRERSKRLIKEYMIPIKGIIRHDDHLMKAIYEMVAYNISLLPVIKNDRVAGVVRSVDLLNEIAIVLDL